MCHEQKPDLELIPTLLGAGLKIIPGLVKLYQHQQFHIIYHSNLNTTQEDSWNIFSHYQH